MENRSVSLDISKIWVPKPTQDKFFKAIHTAMDMGMVAYVGSLGSGKTWALCRAAIGLCYSYPGIKLLIGRFHGTDLRDTTEAEFFKLIDQIEDHIREQLGVSKQYFQGVGVWRASDRNYDFRNGSQILFRPLEQAEEKYKSLEIAGFGIDEASEVQQPAVMMLQARCRQKGYPHVGFVVSNPTGYHHWLYDWFVRKPRSGHILFRTNTLENLENLPPRYVEKLRETYPPDWVRRYLEGEWGGIDEGPIVFQSFTVDDHVRACQFDKRLYVHVGIDFGFKCPAIVWTQIDKENRLHVIRSWFPTNVSAHILAEGVKSRNEVWFPQGVFKYYAGHDGNARKDTGEKTSAEVFASYGMPPKIKFTHIERGLTTIRSLLEVRDDLNPGIIVDPYNERMIEGFLGGYQYEPEKDAIRKDGIYDQLFDALRYVVVNNFTPGGYGPVGEPIYAFRKGKKRAPSR